MVPGTDTSKVGSWEAPGMAREWQGGPDEAQSGQFIKTDKGFNILTCKATRVVGSIPRHTG